MRLIVSRTAATCVVTHKFYCARTVRSQPFAVSSTPHLCIESNTLLRVGCLVLLLLLLHCRRMRPGTAATTSCATSSRHTTISMCHAGQARPLMQPRSAVTAVSVVALVVAAAAATAPVTGMVWQNGLSSNSSCCQLCLE